MNAGSVREFSRFEWMVIDTPIMTLDWLTWRSRNSARDNIFMTILTNDALRVTPRSCYDRTLISPKGALRMPVFYLKKNSAIDQ